MKRKAVLLTTTLQNAEMEELVFALGAELVATYHQRRPAPDPQLFLGSGRMEQVRDELRAIGAELVIVNGQLRAGQIVNLQRFLGTDNKQANRDDKPLEVYDRTRLILEIFRERARSPEARLQVELATLQYEMPLVKEAISMSKKGERQAGMFGGGEYEVNQYYDMMKKRMTRIRGDLEKMRRERGVRRKHRRRSGFHLVSLAGYTNAGKSSLLKALAQKHTVVENRYFSTLSTKTARAQSDRREILVTDTVGFIEDLPPWMVEAFHSTLEEIALADVILLVLDANDPLPEMERRLRSSLKILWEFSGQEGSTDGFPRSSGLSHVLVALNKIDALPQDEDDDDAEVGQIRAANEGGEIRAEDAVGQIRAANEGGEIRAEDAVGQIRAADEVREIRTEDAVGLIRAADEVREIRAEDAVGQRRAANEGGPIRPESEPGESRGDNVVGVIRADSELGVGFPAAGLSQAKKNRSQRELGGESLAAKRRALEELGLLVPGMSVAVSAKTREGLPELFSKLYSLIPDYDDYELALPPSPESESFLAWLHDHADVLDLTRGNEAHVHFEAKKMLRPEIVSRLKAVGATALVEVTRGIMEPLSLSPDEAVPIVLNRNKPGPLAGGGDGLDDDPPE